MTSDRELIRFRTLGAVELRGPEVVGCARVLAQPKRLALFAYLAARPSGERVSRDRIVATFWPDLAPERARANLRNGLYFLRSCLGEEAVQGDEAAVAASPTRVLCDASVLLEPAGSGRESLPGDVAAAFDLSPATHGSLVDLYRGEFLDALHVGGAADFERWVDGMRATLSARASDMAWRLADEAEAAGEWITAAQHARRAVDLAVDVEGATQRLIRLLDRAGDRAAALSEYDRLAWMLAREWEIEPSPETQALIGSVRERRSPAAANPAPRAPVSNARHRSLAVMPFEDLSEGAAGYLAAGVGEDILTALTRVQGVRVVSRTSVRRFASGAPPAMAEVRRLLGVDLVLEGSVQLHGDRVRITVQLIDAARDAHLWAESYDRRLSDVFGVQTDVALRVARALEAALSPREHDRLRRPPTGSTRAWQLYLRGREVWRARDPTQAERAVGFFERALALDEGFGPAWVGLADARLVQASMGPGSLPRAAARAKEAVRRALDCDAELGEAHATLGLIRTFFEPDRDAAGRDYRRGVELSPGYATAHQWYGNWLCGLGRGDEGLPELEHALVLDPLAPAVSDSVGLGLYHLGRVDEAEARFRQTLELDPGFWRGRVSLALCRAARGDMEGAATHLVEMWKAGGYGATGEEALEASRRQANGPRDTLEYLVTSTRPRASQVPGARVLEVVLLMFLERADAAVDALEAAARDGSIGFVQMYSPVLDPLAGSDRFTEVMEGAGILLPRWG